MRKKSALILFWPLIIILAIIGVFAYERYPSAPEEKISQDSTFEHNLLKISQPLKNSIVTSPLIIEGQASGTMFFEASFAITLEDENGKKFSETIAQTAENWMTEDFVAFEAKLEFTKTTSKKGYLIFHRDNPSGLPENDLAIKMPVSF